MVADEEDIPYFSHPKSYYVALGLPTWLPSSRKQSSLFFPGVKKHQPFFDQYGNSTASWFMLGGVYFDQYGNVVGQVGGGLLNAGWDRGADAGAGVVGAGEFDLSCRNYLGGLSWEFFSGNAGRNHPQLFEKIWSRIRVCSGLFGELCSGEPSCAVGGLSGKSCWGCCCTPTWTTQHPPMTSKSCMPWGHRRDQREQGYCFPPSEDCCSCSYASLATSTDTPSPTSSKSVNLQDDQNGPPDTETCDSLRHCSIIISNFFQVCSRKT